MGAFWAYLKSWFQSTESKVKAGVQDLEGRMQEKVDQMKIDLVERIKELEEKIK